MINLITFDLQRVFQYHVHSSQEKDCRKGAASKYSQLISMPSVYCKDFQKLKGIKIKSEETKQRKIKVLNNASLLYDELVSIYKKRI